MWFPEPKRPKNYFNWSLKKRQLFARYMWGPWWKIYEFFKAGPLNVVTLIVERAKFRYSIWKEMRNHNKEWRGMHEKRRGT